MHDRLCLSSEGKRKWFNHPMDIKFTNRLSYKQARLTVLVGFILGTLLSLLQIGIDYASEDASINREIRSLLEISHNPASRIAYNIDAELAQELTLGLLRSPVIIGAQLTDNNGNVLANVKRPGSQSGLSGDQRLPVRRQPASSKTVSTSTTCQPNPSVPCAWTSTPTHSATGFCVGPK